MIYLLGRVDQGIRRELRSRLQRFELSVPEFTPQAMLESLGKLEARRWGAPGRRSA